MEHKKGIALYLLIVITGIGLAIALGVADIVFMESRVTRGLLPSYAVFFAADAGVECALYWHVQKDVFNPPPPPVAIRCNGTDIPASFSSSSGVDSFDFFFDYPDPTGSPYCVSVRVAKATVTGCPRKATIIRSSGQNRSCGGPIVDSTVERTLVSQDPDLPECKFSF